MKKRFLPIAAVAAVLIVAGGVLVFQVLLAQQGPTEGKKKGGIDFSATVEVTKIVESEVQPRQKIVGTIMPKRHSNVGSAASGRVEVFKVNEGQFVKKGDIIAELRTKIIEAEFDTAKAMVAAQQAEVDYLVSSKEPETKEAEAGLAKHKALVDYLLAKQKRLLKLKSNVSQEELEEAIALARQAEESMREAEAALKMLGEPREQKIAQSKAKKTAAEAEAQRLFEQLERHTIKAPFNGYVTKEHTETGEWVLQGGLIASIAELDEVDVEIQVLEDYINFFTEGNEVNVEVPALPDRKFTGKVVYINPQAIIKTRTFPVKVRLKNQPAGESVLLKAGMLARVEVPTSHKVKGLFIPRDALVLGKDSKQIMRFNPTERDPKIHDMEYAYGTAVPVDVQLGAATENQVQIIGGVREGDLLVIRGHERLRFNQAIKYKLPKQQQ